MATEVTLSPAAGRVGAAIAAAAARTGIDFATLFATARLESGLDPDAKAATSSATGLFQFIDSTWLATLARHGARHGIAPPSRTAALELRRDPLVASLMAAELMTENRHRLEGALGRAADAADLYLAHFLGPAGAVRFLSALARTPERLAAELFPAAAAANRAIFHGADGPRTLAEVHALLTRRLGRAMPEASAAARAASASTAQTSRTTADAEAPLAGVVGRLARLLLAGLGG
ncbi:MAG: lytic transglycosylase domain-containing protein [Sphingomonadaceae bacterium]|uniref:transglycosylase SLT domain-containing protein n=1 Tax=Thermaurantiacus sp. TaxID=2820283 RepID=UPI00298F0645|nr:transglycosylase SLT domain-containing protein [Thermaurantiacus sp.]MCS6986829.1 lytic transglycosylase domain-containing protein [Sphingomonadaceae bacterium]MDW8413908.1 transglycosylase SLT domain-containing protein [Thermaurantiacus sp.]